MKMSEKPMPQISEAEWEVMKILWKQHPMTAAEMIDRLDPGLKWKPKTVKTLLSRLVQKKALGYHQDGRSYAYYPLVEEEDCIRAETRSFLRRIYGGSMKPMLIRFLEDGDLSQEEIEELRKILNNPAKGKDDR